MTETKVRYEKRGRQAWITLEDPPANAYTHEMMRQLDDAVLRARFDREVDVLVLEGAGERFFCAGADIGMLERADPEWKYQFCLHANETLLRLEHTPKLVIAAIDGHCVGGGFEIALACDLRIAAEGSGKIGLPEVGLGVLPGTGGTQRLVRLIGKWKAIELIAEGRNLDTAEALELGLVHRLLPREGFREAVFDFAESFCAPRKAAFAVGLVKRACQSGAGVGLEQGLALERELQARLFASADAREGIAAFNEKRRPRFEGG